MWKNKRPVCGAFCQVAGPGLEASTALPVSFPTSFSLVVVWSHVVDAEVAGPGRMSGGFEAEILGPTADRPLANCSVARIR
jgi:hypothetical protein